MVYIIAGASGVLGSAIAEDLSKNNELFLIGRDKEKILNMSEKILGFCQTNFFNSDWWKQEFLPVWQEGPEGSAWIIKVSLSQSVVIFLTIRWFPLVSPFSHSFFLDRL